MSEPVKTRTGMRPWLKAVLAVSLMFNLAVVGLVIGAQFGKPDGMRERHSERREMRDPALGPFARALPAPYDSAAVAALRERAGPRMSRADLAAQLETLLAALRAEPFDAAEVERLFTERRDAARLRDDVGRAVVIEQVTAMSGEERAAFADRLERGFSRALKNIDSKR